MANSPGRSLASYFPDVKPALLLAIVKHEFDPGQIFKIDPQMRDKPRDGHLQLSEAGVLIKAERDASPKEYPSFRSLHDPLHIYFNILMHQLIALGNHQALLDFAHGSSKYMSGLYKLYIEYEWPQVLEYHFRFHNRRIVEMQEGSYGGWEHVDADLMSLHLFGHPKSRPAKPSNQAAWPTPKDVSKQYCHAFTAGKCPSPCKSGRIHKCCKCGSADHSASSCSKSD